MEKRYLTYDSIQLAADDSFIRWTQDGQPSDNDWSRWVSDNPSVSSIVKEAATLVSSIQYKETPQSAKADAIWGRINETIAENTSESKVVQMPKRNIYRLLSYAAAACIAALLAFQVFMTGGDVRIDAGHGETTAHILPDQSKIRLNAGSSIAYDEDEWQDERSLTLNGEAYFEVEKGQKFSVHTPNGVVSVLGTSFNIYSRPDGFRVQCTSGKVQVTSSDDEVILTPNTQTSLTGTGLLKENLDDGIKVNWLNKIYEFDSAPLREVLKSLERQFDIKISSDKQTDLRLYTGSYDATDLEKALQVICFPMELSFKMDGNNVKIEPDEGN